MPTHHLANPKTLLGGAIVLMLVLGLMPVRYLRWAGVDWIGDLADTLLTPISDPASKVSRWLSPASRQEPDPARIAELVGQLEQAETINAQLHSEIRSLRELIPQLEQGLRLNPDLPVRLVPAAVVGTSSDLTGGLLKVRAGKNQGVATNTVAAVNGVHLVGRVVKASTRTCWVQPITSPGAGRIEGLIVTDEQAGDGLICSLSPTGDGTLRGPVGQSAGEIEAPTIEVGQLVRLYDTGRAWPKNARMLIIGRVDTVEPSPAQELRRIVTVRPIVGRLDRVAEVVLRITNEDGS